jgi:hypothetical protein
MCEHMETEAADVMSFERLHKLAADAGTQLGDVNRGRTQMPAPVFPQFSLVLSLDRRP